jgi:hypothetical protein
LGPSFVNLLSLSEIYTRKVVACDFQVQIKRAIENSLLSKLSYETILLQLHLFTLQYRVHYRLQFTLDRIICLLCVYICHWHYICTMWQKKKCPNNEKEICNDKYKSTRDRLFGLRLHSTLLAVFDQYGAILFFYATFYFQFLNL